MSIQFDFYKLFYEFGYLKKEDVYEAAKWGVITKEDYKEIIGEIWKQKYIDGYQGILVKAGRWNLEEVEGETKPIVPENYTIAVAEYLASQN